MAGEETKKGRVWNLAMIAEKAPSLSVLFSASAAVDANLSVFHRSHLSTSMCVSLVSVNASTYGLDLSYSLDTLLPSLPSRCTAELLHPTYRMYLRMQPPLSFSLSFPSLSFFLSLDFLFSLSLVFLSSSVLSTWRVKLSRDLVCVEWSSSSFGFLSSSKFRET